MTERHEFELQIDQTYLGPILRSSEEILRRFPIVGSPA
jgi:hypothetical protein